MATTAATLAVAALTAAVVAVALVLAALAAAQPDRPLAVQDVVNVAVAALGAAVAAWLAVSCALGSACVAGRLVGAGWRSGEALLRRCAPVVVRRAVAGAVGASLGLGLVATGAQAAPVDPAPVAVSVADEAPSDPPAPRTGADGVAEGTLEGPSRGSGVVPVGSVAVDSVRDTGTAPQAPVGAPDPASPALGWPVTAPTDGTSPTQGTAPADGALPPDGPAPAPVAAGWVPTSGAAADGAGGRTDGATGDRARGASAAAQSAGQTAGRSGDRGPATAPDGGADGADVVVVEAGDSLWSIAAAHLPRGASDAQVAAAWPRWYEANRDVVGDDPDVLQPGQQLTAPATEAAR
ncbi:hypothetical protein CUD01_02150 [Cellulomonas uda]|uniref:LysM domain-containing protein n=2 Tax=Cellulomonas uda TaxID=1714 RepID=A0A4Y3K5J8_CELUD|nr:hypothetical protein CUD01_02150 [Cellulomonas uda]